MQDREWYNKVPITEINELIKSTGWDVKKIYVALCIQESNLKIKEREALDNVLRVHWDEPEYKPLKEEYDKILKQIENLGSCE